MSRKFSIVSTIDLKKIDKEIYEYIAHNGHLEPEPYLFMNEDTAKAIEAQISMYNLIFYDNSDNSLSSKKNKKDGVYATYTGYKIFINNDLRFGVVEIR